jgi:O-antigen ligase
VPVRTGRQIAAWSEAGLDTAALLFFPLLVLLPRGIAALTTAAALCAVGLLMFSSRPRPSPALVTAAMLLGCLIFWGILSATWSVDPRRSLVMAARLTGISGVGLALVAAAPLVAAPRRLALFFLGGLVFGIALAAIEITTNGGVSSFLSDRVFQATRLNRASVSFAILVFPASAVLVCRGQKISALLLAAVTAAMILVLDGTAAKAMLLAGIPAGLLLYRSRACVARAAAAISVIVIVTAPLSFARLERFPGLGETADSIKISAGHRLLIWSFAGDRIAERALTGWGLDASRAMPGGQDLIRPGESWMPLHPHNAPLQLWLELGVPGIVLFALLAALIWLSLARAEWPRLFAAAAGASLAVALVACFATYGIWQEWWLGTLWFSFFLVLVLVRLAHPVAASGASALDLSHLPTAGRSPSRRG